MWSEDEISRLSWDCKLKDSSRLQEENPRSITTVLGCAEVVRHGLDTLHQFGVSTIEAFGDYMTHDPCGALVKYLAVDEIRPF